MKLLKMCNVYHNKVSKHMAIESDMIYGANDNALLILSLISNLLLLAFFPWSFIGNIIYSHISFRVAMHFEWWIPFLNDPKYPP